MKNKVIIVLMREYLKNVRKVSFWLATLFFPVFIAIIGFISGYSGTAIEKKLADDAKSAQKLLVVDHADIVDTTLYPNFIELYEAENEAIDLVKKNEADAVIVIPSDVRETKKIEIHAVSKGILSRARHNDFAANMVKQSILGQINDPQLIELVNAGISVNVTSYKDGGFFDDGYTKLIVPIASVVIYFLLISLGNNFLLMSVSEEKENRMIEVVLTSVKPKQLILGKIIGQVATVITQLVVLFGLAAIALKVTDMKSPLPIDFSSLNFTPATVLLGLFYIIVGFLILGNIMVGVGAAMPTYKEAQNFSAVFIILSILPVYFFSVIIADPSGTIAQITSYFPLTAPMILLFRQALGELSVMETLLSGGLLVIYAYITYYIAVKLFEFGSLEYNKKISFQSFLHAIRKK